MPGRATVIPLALGASLLLGGCQYLYGFDPTDPDAFAPPSPLATYVEGNATIAIADDPLIELGRISSAALYDSWYGGEGTWSNADGWYVRVYGATGTGAFGLSGSVTLDRIVDGQHWTTFDTSRCIVTIEAADAKALRGSAICKGLRWSDALGGSYGSMLEPGYVAGQDPFDAEITFVATPASGTAT